MKSTRQVRFGTMFVVALAILAIAGVAVACEVRTIGYWKNHPEAWSPDVDLVVGGVHVTKENAIPIVIPIMQTPVKGDKTYNLFNAVVAAWLNWLTGAGFPFNSTTVAFESALGWLSVHPVGSDVAASSPAWKEAEPWFDELQAYNSGLRGVPAGD